MSLYSEATPLLSNQSNATPHAQQAPTETIPPACNRDFRTIVVLFDGTGDTKDDDITNVLELQKMLYPQKDPEKQLVFYREGLGTSGTNFPGTDYELPLSSKVSQTIDQAVAWSLKDQVIGGYKIIMDNYREGDKICLFGFSRGAYTARAVGAMIHKVGLLPVARSAKLELAYESYEMQGKESWALSTAFKKENECMSATIEFIGVWDTVSSVGALKAKTLHHTARNPSVRTFRHAMALDEHRARFRVNRCLPPDQIILARAPFITDVDQVWFAGGHCDVGGGSVPNGTCPNLAHISLRWMVRECFKTNNGMLFDPSKFKAIGIAPESFYPKVKERPAPLEPSPDLKVSTNNILKPGIFGRAKSWVSSFWKKPTKAATGKNSEYEGYTEEQRDLVDALAPLYDQLVIKRAKWFLLEVLPLTKKPPSDMEADMYWWNPKRLWAGHSANWWKGRSLLPPKNPEQVGAAKVERAVKTVLDDRWAKIRVHRTVKARMACAGDEKTPRYVPKAHLNGVTFDMVDPKLIQWVD